MSAIKNKKLILDTIDQLRSQKSRPDINRICKHMLRSHKVSPKDTKADLQKCVKENSVVKIYYKDNVSYRNAAKWRKKSQAEDMALSAAASSERRIITSAIATLIYQDQSNLENGIAFEDLVKSAAAQDPKYAKRHLEIIIQKELTSGSLVKLPNGNLALGPADHDPDSSDSFKFEYNADSNNTKLTSSANSSCRSSPQRTRGRPRKGQYPPAPKKASTAQNSGVRVGERRKMAKKVFDPSDNNLPSKRKRGRPVGSLNKSTLKKHSSLKDDKEADVQSESQDGSEAMEDMEMDHEEPVETSGVCSVCLVQKPRGSHDKLVECRDCSNKAHLSCLQSGSGILKLRPDNTWQCPHCKTCVVCCETNDAGVLTVCSVCSDAYHALCHAPRIPERLKAWDQWECNNCLDSRPTVVGSPAIIPELSPKSHLSPKSQLSLESNLSPKPSTPPSLEPFLKPHERERAAIKSEALIDESIPNDVVEWTSGDVYEYFMEHYPEAAPILKDQEIDGQALCVARRSDIVKGLGLPLGPALAVYRIVLKLQTRKDDWTMCWG